MSIAYIGSRDGMERPPVGYPSHHLSSAWRPFHTIPWTSSCFWHCCCDTQRQPLYGTISILCTMRPNQQQMGESCLLGATTERPAFGPLARPRCLAGPFPQAANDVTCGPDKTWFARAFLFPIYNESGENPSTKTMKASSWMNSSRDCLHLLVEFEKILRAWVWCKKVLQTCLKFNIGHSSSVARSVGRFKNIQ